MKNALILLLLLMSSVSGYGQTDSSEFRYEYLMCATARMSAQREVVYLGVEQDILPYFLKGFIVSGWVQKNANRFRLSYAEANVPGFYVDEAVKTDRVKVLSANYEYFRNYGPYRLWFGPGVGYWTNRVETKDLAQAKNTSVVLTLGAGFNYYNYWVNRKLRKIGRLYISPWVATHFRVTGLDPVQIGDYSYQPALFTPEVSLKIGMQWALKKKR